MLHNVIAFHQIYHIHFHISSEHKRKSNMSTSETTLANEIYTNGLFGAKPLPKPMLIYYQLDSWEQLSVKFEPGFYHSHSRKCNWNCRLPKWRPSCPGRNESSAEPGLLKYKSLKPCSLKFMPKIPCNVINIHHKNGAHCAVFWFGIVPINFTQCVQCIHYSDDIMGTIASQITSLTIVYSPFIQTRIKENIKAPRHWPLCGEFTGDRWIPRTNGQ